MNINALIIEDEIPARNTIKSYLNRYFKDVIAVVGEIDSTDEALLFLQQHCVDIIFLDVQLRDSFGIDLLKKINTSNYRIIFTTAFDNYTKEAFKAKSFGYLLKPIDPFDFKEIVERSIRDVRNSNLQSEKIKIPIPSGSVWVDINRIVYCKAENNYTRLFVENDPTHYTLSKTLKFVHEKILHKMFFIRIHQSYLVNMYYVKEPKIKNNCIQLKTNEKLPVARARKKEVESYFSKQK